MSDPQDKAEALDEEELATDVAPDRPLGVEDYGTTAQEQRIQEPLEERVRREVPDGTSGAPPAGEEGALADDDRFTGDETTRDVATEREAPTPAEEDALRVTDQP